MDVLRHEAKTKEFPPSSIACNLDVIPDEPLTFVRFVAADNSWRKKCIIHSDVVQSDVVHVDERLRLTTTERVKHASWSIMATWLLLLLWTNVDSPPNRLVNLYVVVGDVGDLSA